MITHPKSFNNHGAREAYFDTLPKGWGVHITHCCPGGCAYGDTDCPVATHKAAPFWECEDCKCVTMHPEAIAEAPVWWDNLTAEQKAQVYLNRDL